MAKDVTGQPWYFDASGQGEGRGPSLDGVSVVFPTRVYIKRVKLYTGDGTTLLVYDRKTSPPVLGLPGEDDAQNSRHIVLHFQNLAAQDNFEIPIEATLLGFYVETLPTNAYLEVFHGEAS